MPLIFGVAAARQVRAVVCAHCGLRQARDRQRVACTHCKRCHRQLGSGKAASAPPTPRSKEHNVVTVLGRWLRRAGRER